MGVRETKDIEKEPIIRGRVLIVDDDIAVRSIMARLLRAHDVVQAENGNSARAILEEDQNFDLIICDLIMSMGSGIELYEWLLSKFPGLTEQIIFVTGGVFTPHATSFLKSIDNPCLEKPLDISDFVRIARDFIRVSKRDENS